MDIDSQKLIVKRILKRFVEFLKEQSEIPSIRKVCSDCSMRNFTKSEDGKLVSRQGCVWCTEHKTFVARDGWCERWKDLKIKEFKTRLKAKYYIYLDLPQMEDLVKRLNEIEKRYYERKNRC